MAFAIYGSSQLFCVVWQVMMFASFAVITYAYLQIEVCATSFSIFPIAVITYAYLQIEVRNYCDIAAVQKRYNLRISAD